MIFQTTSKNTMEKEKSCVIHEKKIDILDQLYLKDMFSVLELIIFSLPPRTLQICKNVNKQWKTIVGQFHDSVVPRLRNIQDQLLAVEWKKKLPIIKISINSIQFILFPDPKCTYNKNISIYDIQLC